MISVDEALQLVQEHVLPLPSKRVPLKEAANLVLAEDIVSGVNSPPHDKAQMDGYAVASTDVSPSRKVVERVAAGDVPHRAVIPGTAVRIMTGAPLPEGADAVIPFEEVEEEDDTIQFDPDIVKAEWHVAKLGSCIREGQVVVTRGHKLRPVDIGLVAEVGFGVVEVIPTCRVAVLPTGNELVTPGQALRPGQISNSNGPMLCAAAENLGCQTVDLGIGRDDRDQLKAAIENGLSADVLLLSGGVSAGDFDLVPGVLAELGVRQVFHKVALRPGRPLWFGLAERASGNTLVFGLPGNPVSSYVCLELFVRPALTMLAGGEFTGLEEETATLSHAHTHRGKRTAFLPARTTKCIPQTVELIPWHGSGDLAALCRANSLVKIPANTKKLKAGETVQLLRI